MRSLLNTRNGLPVTYSKCRLFDQKLTRLLVQFNSDQKNKEANALQKEIGKKFKAKEDPSELVAQKNALQKEKEVLVTQAKEKEASWKNKLNQIGNIVHASVPTSMDEVGEIRRSFIDIY